MSENDDRLQWEARPDGIYLLVMPEHAGDINIEEIRTQFIKDRVMNFDMKRIEEVVRAARGKSTFVGPNFVRLDARKLDHIKLFVSPKVAKLRIWASIEKELLEITVKDVEYLLMRENVVHGVDWGRVSKMVNNKEYDEDVIIAQCTEPENGSDAKIREAVKIDPNAAPLVLNDGNVDFKNLDNIRQIKEGDLIARRIPPTPGKPGTNLFGKPLAPKPGVDVFLPRGENTDVNGDNTELLAASSGYLYRREGNICVGCLYVVAGDVNFKSGNVDYQGDVYIRGNVLSDFKVESNGNITIEGIVEGAEIVSREGMISIKKGIFGKDKARIVAKKGIEVFMAQDCVLDTEGDVLADKHLMNCKILADSVKPRLRNLLISACDLRIYSTVSCSQLGNRKGAKTVLLFVNKEAEVLNRKFQELTELYEKIQGGITALQTRLKTMKNILKKMEEVPERSRNELKKVLAQYTAAQKKLEFVEKKRKDLATKRDNPVDLPACLTVAQFLPELHIDMYGREMVLKDEAKNLVADWRAGDLSVRTNVKKED